MDATAIALIIVLPIITVVSGIVAGLAIDAAEHGWRDTLSTFWWGITKSWRVR